MGRGYLVVEGHGEVLAALNLVTRLWKDLQCRDLHWATPPIRGLALHTREGLLRACRLVRSKGDAELLLILRDEDDACPRVTGPCASSWVREERLPFPAAVVLIRREFESLFLPCLARMAGKRLVDDRGIERPGIIEGTTFSGDVEALRDAKGWLGKHFPRGFRYKPTLDQLPLTRLLDFGDLRKAAVPSFGTLERALLFLAGEAGGGDVYPKSGLAPPP